MLCKTFYLPPEALQSFCKEAEEACDGTIGMCGVDPLRLLQVFPSPTTQRTLAAQPMLTAALDILEKRGILQTQQYCERNQNVNIVRQLGHGHTPPSVTPSHFLSLLQRLLQNSRGKVTF